MTNRLNKEKVRLWFGIDKSTFNRMMLEGVLPIAIMSGEKRHTYYILRNRLEKYLGRSLTEEEIEGLA